MLKSLFSKENTITDVTIYAPIDGKLVSLEEVPDPVFSQKMMGNGIAIMPTNGTVISPVQGKVLQVFPTKHAIGIKAANGAEILIHIGLETVELKSDGFTVYVQEGDNIKKGERLIDFDIDLIKRKAKSIISPVIITNTAEMSEIRLSNKETIQAGQDEILFVKRK